MRLTTFTTDLVLHDSRWGASKLRTDDIRS